ncbi:ShlB/FhaC/HecB family hemolysin secretion/activation protein [Sulfitobacter sp. F26204]|uniref:ShlB/FhaC/HecB family hemolysin secretion/activation protein n=1 Tax=Sulfitobacter sp. F26204 TaxID=2996014 RepID=UPI00225DFD1A|nr:ShlB/FhaC/HecB family hemolysin secretion/activation protein [Sulfitobacter sp. F26204]MCX7561218.1 ShlB/FhaC/HecB family hemolysin secretion/activation protein [Sulfitobacter sp. F26204]
MLGPILAKRALLAPILLREKSSVWAALMLCCAVGIGTVATNAQAQTASEITSSTFAPDAQRLKGSVVFSGERGTKAPAGSEKLLINLKDVDLDGGLPQMAEINAATRARLSGKTITVAEIFNATSDLETAYTQAGFVLARVVLPAQELRDGGKLRIVVIDGFVEEIDTANVPLKVRNRITRITEPLVGKRSLRLPEIERQLLLAGDTYGVSLGSALAAGATPGGTSLILQPEFRPVTGFFAFDNSNASSLGPVSLSAGVEFNSPFDLGETLYARISGSPANDNDNGLGAFLGSDPRVRTLSVGGVIPVGFDGLTLNIEATDSRTAPDPLAVPSVSRFERTSVRLFYPFIRSRNRNISGQLTLERQTDEQFLVGPNNVRTLVYEDKTSVLRAAVDGFWLTDGGSAIEAGAVLSRGFDILNARTAADVGTGTPLSRQGADAEFTKLIVSGRLRRTINEKFNFSLAGRAQSSFGDAMLTSEQFGIAGSQELSGFDAGSIRGDSGFVARAEISMPQQTSFGDTPLLVSPYIFAAYGNVSLEAPTLQETKDVSATSFGLGVELNTLSKSNFSSATMRIEYARGTRDDDLPDNNRFSIQGSFRF